MTKPKPTHRKTQETSRKLRGISSQFPISTREQEPEEREVFGARVSRRATERLRKGHVWVYASDVVSVELPSQETEVPALLPVADYRGLLLGTALYSQSYQITLRKVS